MTCAAAMPLQASATLRSPLALVPSSKSRYQASADRPEVLDLRERWLDVRRIAKSRPEFKACMNEGWDGDDLWMEVYTRALARQSMPSRYDPRRSGVGKYLVVLCRSILRNLLDSAQRRRRWEQIGAWGPDAEVTTMAGRRIQKKQHGDAALLALAIEEQEDQ